MIKTNMENNINDKKTGSQFGSSDNNRKEVGSSRNHSGPLDSMVEQNNIADVIVGNNDVIISQGVLLNSSEISHSSEKALSTNDECAQTKKECIELEVNSSLPVSSSPTFHTTFSRTNRTKSPSFQHDWKEAAERPVLHVHCRKITGQLHKDRFGSGAKGKSIQVGKLFFTPTEFEAHCGRSASKDWKRSIRFRGRTLQTLIEEGLLQVHASSCSCAICLEDSLAAGPVRLYQQCKRRRRPRTTEETKLFKRCQSDAFPDRATTTITLPVTELGELNDANTSVPSLTNIEVDFSGVEDISELPLEKAWDQMNQTLVNLEKGLCKSREMLEALRERTNREIVEQRRALLQEKEDAINQTKLETHLSSVERSTENEFLVEVQSTTHQSVNEDENASNTIQPVMLDSLATPLPNLCSSHIKKKCVNCNRETCSECVCRRKPYCSSFCQRRDWTHHRQECSALRNSPAREVSGFIFMI